MPSPDGLLAQLNWNFRKLPEASPLSACPKVKQENADDINLLCRYVQESVPVSDIKAILDEIRTQKILCEEWGQPVRARGLMDAIMVVNKHMGMHGKLEGFYGLSDNT